jgi:monoamine oxidase
MFAERSISQSPSLPVSLSYRAPHAIITLPLALLKADAVAFDPPLPEAKRHAIDALTMAPAIKLLLRFDERFWDAEMTFLSGRDPVPVWWTVRRDVPLLTGFITGPRAARLAAHGPENALEQGIAALTAIFGAAPRRLFAASQVVDWAADEWARGGYSSVPPGAHGQRAMLAQPVGALHFAGEATVFANNPATVHGALHSGVRAAREIIDGY